MERCPNCRARLEEGAQHCRRCGMELQLLRRTEHAAAVLRERAVAALAAGDPQRARRRLERAQALSADALAGQLLAFIDTPRGSADTGRSGGPHPGIPDGLSAGATRGLRPVAHRHRDPAPAQRGPGEPGP